MYQLDLSIILYTNFNHLEKLDPLICTDDRREKTIEDSIKKAAFHFIDSKIPFTVKDIKESQGGTQANSINESSIVKLLKDDLKLSYK